MPPSNRASWLMSKQSPINVVDSAPYTSPSNNELVIKTAAIALNPADVAIQNLGILLNDYPAILGCDVAGEVVEVGPSMADVYSIGDRVIGAANCLNRKDGVYCYSAFQEYVVLKSPCIAKVPKEASYEDAAVLPLGINTAASCLFMDETLGLKAPSIDGTKTSQGKTLLIWGASSSVGSCGVQMATQAGYEVVGVASKRNHEMVKGLGASICFDRGDPTLVDDIVIYLDGKEVVGAFDAISQDSTLNAICEILDRSGGRKLLASVKPGAEEKATKGVKIVTNFATGMGSREKLFKAIWEWLSKAMEEKWIIYMPQSEVVGEGLEKVQQAVDLLAKGVSAKKLVVSM
jgi:NADPH:quinone reductase-like Zn-dependent oxidoreductase